MLAQLVYLISLNNVGRIPDVINVGWDSYNKSVNSTRYTRELLQSLCELIMTSNCKKFIDLVKVFEGDMMTDGQSWCDVGADLCKEVLQNFTDSDWKQLKDEYPNHNDEWTHTYMCALQLVEIEYTLPLLSRLLLSHNELIWNETLIELSLMYKKDKLPFKNIGLSKDEIELIINKVKNKGGKYFHPKDENITEFLNFLDNSHNKSFQPTADAAG